MSNNQLITTNDKYHENTIIEELPMIGPINVTVAMGDMQLSTTTIATYGLTACYFLLIDGYYKSQPFAGIYHHSFWIEPSSKGPAGILKFFLNKITDVLEKDGFKYIDNTRGFSLDNYNNLKLVVGGSRTVDLDPIKDALSLLIGSTESFSTELQSLVKADYPLLIDKLMNNVTILNGTTYLASEEDDIRESAGAGTNIEPPSSWIEYNCRSKKGILGIGWGSLFGKFDMAFMIIDLSAKNNKQTYRWNIQNEKISSMAKEISSTDYEISALGRALSVIPEKSMYVPTPPSLLIEASKPTSHPSTIHPSTSHRSKRHKPNNDVNEQVQNKNKYAAFGEQILSYKLKGEKSTSYLINRVNQHFCDDQQSVAWYNRFKKFLVSMVDDVSMIDKDDPNWIIYLLYEQYQNKYGQTRYAPIGNSTVYLYYACPDKKRPRINRIFILPLYQRKGHGRRLLTAIYTDLNNHSLFYDITAKNPSKEFIALRDLVSLELCHKYLPGLFSKESILKTNQLTKNMIDQARAVCKLTKQETRRVYEMCFLQSVNRNDEEQMKQFRLIVKQRLSYSLQFDKRRRHCLQLADPALEALATDPEKRKKYLATQYEYVLESYQNILRAFNKYHSNLFLTANILSK